MAYIGISHRGTLVGIHPTSPWIMNMRMDRYIQFLSNSADSLKWSSDIDWHKLIQFDLLCSGYAFARRDRDGCFGEFGCLTICKRSHLPRIEVQKIFRNMISWLLLLTEWSDYMWLPLWRWYFQMCCWKHQLEGLFRWRCVYQSLACGCLFTRISDHLLCMLLREYRSQNGYYTTVYPRKLPSSLWKRKLFFPTTERDMLVWILGIQSPSKNGSGTFQWLDTPIIPWQYDWIPRGRVPGAGSSSPPKKNHLAPQGLDIGTMALREGKDGRWALSSLGFCTKGSIFTGRPQLGPWNSPEISGKISSVILCSFFF